MKKTMRKYLSIVLAVLMLTSSFGVGAFAGTTCDHKGGYPSDNPEYYTYVNATCETGGYISYHCMKCGTKDVYQGPIIDAPLGHKWDINKPVYIAVDGNNIEQGEAGFNGANVTHYHKYYECIREFGAAGSKEKCTHREYEKVINEKVNYYTVEFVNHRETASYYEDVTYTKVAKTFKTGDVLYSAYVKEGESAVYDAKILPKHEKTKEYAAYTFLGWSDTAIEPLSNPSAAEKEAAVADCENAMSSITANTVFYPVFAGSNQTDDGEITHDVNIYIYNGYNQLVPGTKTQKIAHGGTPAYGVGGTLYPDPEMTGNMVEEYEFTGWKFGADGDESKQISTAELVDKNITKIYGNVSFYPCFKSIARNYTIVFCDSEGHVMRYQRDNNGDWLEAKFNNINLRTNLNNNSLVSEFTKNADNMFKQKDETYIYEWAGNFKVLNSNTVTDLSYFNINGGDYIVSKDQYGNVIYVDENAKAYDIITDSENENKALYYRNTAGEIFYVKYDNKGNVVGFTDANGIDSPLHIEEKRVIYLTPVYYTKVRLYDLNVRMVVPSSEDVDYYLGEAIVQVIDVNGQLVAKGKTDANGEFKCQVYHSLPIRVSVATADDKYLGEKQVKYLLSDDNAVTVCSVDMTLNPNYGQHCNCICHNAFIRPIWVRILNILYHFFNVKYVCCYDMYANLGPMLDYTK